MIKIQVEKENEQYRKVVIEGHAMYDDYGKDIVCSGVSAIVITTVNGLCLLDDAYLSLKEEKDRLTITILKHDTVSETLIENMVRLLKQLANDYPKNVQIK